MGLLKGKGAAPEAMRTGRGATRTRLSLVKLIAEWRCYSEDQPGAVSEVDETEDGSVPVLGPCSRPIPCVALFAAPASPGPFSRQGLATFSRSAVQSKLVFGEAFRLPRSPVCRPT